MSTRNNPCTESLINLPDKPHSLTPFKTGLCHEDFFLSVFKKENEPKKVKNVQVV